MITRLPSNLFRLFLWGVAFGGISLLNSARAQPDPSMLTVGQGWAWVREFFPSSGEQEIDQIVWSNPPPQIELDTLQVWNIRRLWPIRDWQWIEPPESISPNGPPLLWKPQDIHKPSASPRQLQIRLAEPLSHRLGHSLTYRLPQMDWSAFYHVTVRGIGLESTDAVQVDITALVRIHNDTSAEFPRAIVSLMGADSTLLPPPKPFGRLDLNPDSPLSDLWLSRQERMQPIPSLYSLEMRATLQPHQETEIQFAQVLRKPAQITHLCDSDQIPTPTIKGGIPLQRRLLIPNTPAMGLGFPLPAGEADLFLGSRQGAAHQSGHVYPTPFPGVLQLDLGPVETVRASRQMDEQQPLPEGAWQADYSITVVNTQKSIARIQVVEKPSTPLKWNLVKSSLPCHEKSGTLNFDLVVQPQSTTTIRYRLRLLSQPK